MQGALVRLKKMAGSAAALELLDRFLEETPARLDACQQALLQGDMLTLQHNLHRLRSDAGWLGAKQVHELSGQGETLAIEGNGPELAILLETLSGLCYEASQELHRQRTLLLGSQER